MKTSRVFLCLTLCAVVVSCKPKVPDEYLQPGEFEDILYDYHLADAMADGGDNALETDYNVILYRQAVLEKYGITQAEFDSSLVYYMRHADRLHQVYENLTERLEEDAMALGASANDIRRYGDMASARDTLNMWTGVPAAMFTPSAPYNVMSFEIAADSTYRQGDKIIFSFNCDFIYNEGAKDGWALLAVQFKNDSVAGNTTHMTTNSNYSITVSDSDRKGIKAIRGFIYLGKRGYDRGTGGNDLCLMFVDNIRMVRMHTPKPADTQQADSTKAARKDSVRRGERSTGSVFGVGENGRNQQTPDKSSKPLKLSDVRPLPRIDAGKDR